MGSDRQREQFVQLLASHQQRLAAYMRALIPSSSDADDVLQEVNLFLWRHADEYEPGTNFSAWAYKVARYHVLGFRKQRPRSRLRFSDVLLEQLIEAAVPEADFTPKRMEALTRCLQKLSEKDRTLISLRYERGATTQSVAERSGRSLKGVYHSLNRIRTTLLQCIQRTLVAEARQS